ncbi:MAG: sulfotransferase, partial [Rickettsiales bacterium]|nr:sulfotransferase [Rickettsiales bacterium]
MDYPPVFIVGTGRCGSTLLSSMINSHPDILSISEFFSFISDLGTNISKTFPGEPITADAFWELIAGLHKKQNLMIKHNIAMSEVLYPFDNPNSQYNRNTGVPAILQTTLPHLTNECDSLYDTIKQWVLSQETQPIKMHYLALFTYLKTHFNKKLWVERSGGSLRVIHRLKAMFPNAKFIHIVRDGRDCALSMSKHFGFRMVLTTFQIIEILGLDPYTDHNRDYAHDLPDDLYPLLPEHFDRNAFIDYDIPLSLYAHYWSGELSAAAETLKSLPKQQLMTVRYEQLLEQPNEVMTSLLSFLELEEADPEWLESISKQIRKPRSSWQQLSDTSQASLKEACDA